ncbi:MAG: site-specific integrase, partial [Polyangiaceae bacterium]
MSRPSTGTVRILLNDDGQRQWHARWTLSDGSRGPYTPLPASIRLDDEAAAKAYAAKLAPRIRKASAKGGGTGVETVADYAERWCAARKAKGLGCASGDAVMLERHVLPVIGALAMTQVGKADLKRLVASLDEKVGRGKSGDGKPFGWKTAVNTWGTVRAMFRDAVTSKDVALCVRDDNPARDVVGPDVGSKKSKVYLWPSDFAALVSASSTPLRWKRLFSLAVYTYMRAGELAALRWEDVDLEHLTIHVHRSADRVRKRGVKATKSDTARTIPIEPALLPLLETMRDEVDGRGLVFKMPSVAALARKLKFYLRRAGVTRANLFASDATRKAVTFHDLRATGITWAAVRGDEPLRIM